VRSRFGLNRSFIASERQLALECQFKVGAVTDARVVGKNMKGLINIIRMGRYLLGIFGNRVATAQTCDSAICASEGGELLVKLGC